MDLAMSDLLTEAETSAIESAQRDPASVTDAVTAAELIEYLNEDITNIETQLASARIEREVYERLPEDRAVWVRKASYSLARKREERGALCKRLVALVLA
jgi:hypothetical protein